jgi:hypothetical protein
MSLLQSTRHDGGVVCTVPFAQVKGTHGTPYLLGTDGGADVSEIEVQGYFISITPVTQSV